MDELFNIYSIDISALRWGQSPTPVLPKALCELWKDEKLPDWVIADTRLPAGSTINALGVSLWQFAKRLHARVQHFVRFFVQSRTQSIGHLKCFDREWPPGLKFEEIPFSTRSLHLLKSRGLSENIRAITALSFYDLLAIPGLGVKSLLEITTLVEAAMDIHDRVSSKLSDSTKLNDRIIPNEITTGEIPSIETLREALQEPWVELVSPQDPRFSAVLPAGSGTLEERIERCLSDPNSGALEATTLIRSIEQIRNVALSIETQPLERSLSDLLAGILRTNDPQKLQVMAARLGWDGKLPRTLQECGELIGVSRERIRQIETKAIRQLPKHPVFLPKIDPALALLEKAAPIQVDNAAKLLKQHGITDILFSPASLIEAARLLGHKSTLTIHDVRGAQVVVTTSSIGTLGSVIRVARKLAGQAGVASVFQVSDTVAGITNLLAEFDIGTQEITEDEIRRLLREVDECESLNEDWFWFTDIPEGRNRLSNITKRILSVASPQSITSIREGVRRAFRFRSSSNRRYRSLSVPPLAVMEQFYRRHPEFRLDDDTVGTVKPLDYREWLGETEQTFVEVFRSSPTGVLDRKSLVDACIARGLNENTLVTYTTYSPMLEHVGIDIWKLRGVRVDPAAVEALREQNQLRPREDRLLEFGWNPDGRLWVAWKIPRVAPGLVFGVPGAVRRYLANRTFMAKAKETGRDCGQVSINDQGSSYGYVTFLRYDGADSGDILLAEFDLTNNVADLIIADTNILET